LNDFVDIGHVFSPAKLRGRVSSAPRDFSQSMLLAIRSGYLLHGASSLCALFFYETLRLEAGATQAEFIPFRLIDILTRPVA
jgi:hypothetical protein